MILPIPLLQRLVDDLVIDEGIEIVHALRIDFRIKPLDPFSRNPLSEVRLDAIHPQVIQALKTPLEPLNCFRVCEINQAHASLPEIPLPDVSILTLQEVPFLRRISKNWRCLANIRVRPNGDFIDKIS